MRAKEMGHDVVVYEKRDVIGGELISASIPDFKWDVKRLLQYYVTEVQRVGLEIRTGNGGYAGDTKSRRPGCSNPCDRWRGNHPEYPRN